MKVRRRKPVLVARRRRPSLVVHLAPLKGDLLAKFFEAEGAVCGQDAVRYRTNTVENTTCEQCWRSARGRKEQ